MRDTTYRFHGRNKPQNRVRTPIRAEAPGATTSGVAKIHLYDPIDSYGGYWGVSAAEFVETLNGLPDDTSEIRLHVNSPGGEVFEGIAIMNALRQHPASVTAVVDGLAASAASFIAVSADKVLMNPNTELMIHDAWGITIGPAADHEAMKDRLNALSDNIASVYAAKTGGAAADWRPAMLAETWYSADEAVAAGLADGVLGQETTDAPADEEPIDPADAEQARAAFDLGMFTYPGRASAPGPALARSAAPTDRPLPGDTYGPEAAAAREARAARYAARAARMAS
jgi:ATP-dependent Clp endopeptidase proteolytic subunit ClpP